MDSQIAPFTFHELISSVFGLIGLLRKKKKKKARWCRNEDAFLGILFRDVMLHSSEKNAS